MESIFAKNKLLIFAILMAGGIFMFSGGSKRKGRKYLRIKVSTIFIVSSLLVIVAFSLANVITFEKREISYGTTSAGGLRI
jgi:membrane-associated HD superfamily phosphohydrolase